MSDKNEQKCDVGDDGSLAGALAGFLDHFYSAIDKSDYGGGMQVHASAMPGPDRDTANCPSIQAGTDR